jgi:hypothetical protein
MKTTLASIAAVALLAGCSTTPNYDARFGDAVRDARMAMTAYPDAASKQDPVAGMDGQAARAAFTRYQETFKAPPPVVNVINIGGAIGSK